MRYAEVTTAAPLSGRLLPRPNLGRVGLIASWDNEPAVEAFLAGHPLAEQLAHGWHVRLQPMRAFGTWPQLPGLPATEEPMDDTEPAAVLTRGRLRLSQTLRFLRERRCRGACSARPSAAGLHGTGPATRTGRDVLAVAEHFRYACLCSRSLRTSTPRSHPGARRPTVPPRVGVHTLQTVRSQGHLGRLQPAGHDGIRDTRSP